MIEDVETGRVITTEARPVEPDDFGRLGPGWRFDWRTEVEADEVFKLIDPVTPGVILGLIALRRCENYVAVTLLESHPRNVGRSKTFRGIPGSLLAFAAQICIDIGGGGFLVMEAKNELIEHYERAFGFERIGRSQRMTLNAEAAVRLIGLYGGGPAHE